MRSLTTSGATKIGASMPYSWGLKCGVRDSLGRATLVIGGRDTGKPRKSSEKCGSQCMYYTILHYQDIRADATCYFRRKYYERTNSLIQQYIYIDRLLDSSLPHDLLNEYTHTPSSGPSTYRESFGVPATISEDEDSIYIATGPGTLPKRVKRTPREIYRISEEHVPLLQGEEDDDDYDGPKPEIPGMEDDSVESGDRIVQIAIYVNLAANTILLAGKLAVIFLTNSLSVLASLVDAALDFLSTAIVWTTTRLIERQDHYRYPVGRRRLEPVGVLVFSVIMVTSFVQVALECLSRLNSADHTVIELGLPAVIIMSSTVMIKALCWLWCRLIKNSSVQALAQDAMTDVIFNIFSIIFPLGTLLTSSACSLC
jgi:hypothetical protein